MYFEWIQVLKYEKANFLIQMFGTRNKWHNKKARKSLPSLSSLFSTKNTVTRISKPWQDIAVLIKAFI